MSNGQYSKEAPGTRSALPRRGIFTSDSNRKRLVFSSLHRYRCSDPIAATLLLTEVGP